MILGKVIGAIKPRLSSLTLIHGHSRTIIVPPGVGEPTKTVEVYYLRVPFHKLVQSNMSLDFIELGSRARAFNRCDWRTIKL